MASWDPSRLRSEATGLDTALLALLFLSFLQLLTDFVASVYAAGLLRTSIPTEIWCVLLLFAPVLLVLVRGITPAFVILTGELMLLSRAASLVLESRGKMLAAGIGTAAFLVCLPAMLWRLRTERHHAGGARVSLGLALATLLYAFLQALSSGNDITGLGAGRYLGIALALAAGVGLCWWGRRASGEIETIAAELTVSSPGSWRVAGLCLGCVGVLGMLYLGLAFPGVLARWTHSDYLWITALVSGPAALSLAWSWRVPGWPGRLSLPVLLGWNLLFLSALGLAVWSSRLPFPADVRAYPFPEPPIPWPGQIGLVVMLLLSPVLYVNLGRFTEALTASLPSVRTLGWSFALASLWLLLLVFAQVFTTGYDYIPVVGPWFRDRFWLVLFVAGLGAALPALLLRPEWPGEKHPPHRQCSRRLVAVGVALAAAAVGAVALTQARPSPLSLNRPLRVMTFNLQQGYNARGTRHFAGQLDLIRRVNPDLVGLQETDTTRVAGGNTDLVRFLADRLNYYAFAGPRTSAGTFGIALISRFPIDQARTFYLYSTGEQTAVLTAKIRAGGTVHSVFVTHLGNGGPAIQQREVLDLVAAKTNVILMGDFNFRPGKEQYHLTLERLEDAWVKAAEKRVDPPTQDVPHRIDHVFVSPGTPVARAAYLDPGASDHPAMVVEVSVAR